MSIQPIKDSALAAENILRGSRHWELLQKRMVKNMQRSVFRVDGCYVVKKYELPLIVRLHRRPWTIEDACLRRLDGDDAPRSFGWLEQIEANRRVVWLLKEYIAGYPVSGFVLSDVPDIARLLARIHSRRIITDDAHPQNFIRSLDGRLMFTDFGRARLHACHGPCLFVRIGWELAKLRRQGFQWDPDLWAAFHPIYFRELGCSALSRALIWISCETAIGMRMARKTLQGKASRS